jgi:tetratricopeptide (TPR) repeat protein
MRLPHALSALTLLLAPWAAQSQSTEAEFDRLWEQAQTAEAEALARQRLQANPKDDVALWAWARSVAGNPSKRAEVVAKAESCVAERPQSARCHHALGSLYGAMATSSGMTEGIKLAGKIKEHLRLAAELDPRHFTMRADLIQFDLQAPGIVGGSVRQAVTQAQSYASIDPHRAKLLRAQVHLYEKEFSEAAVLLGSVPSGADPNLLSDFNDALSNLGFAQIQTKQYEPALKTFDRVLAQNPQHAASHFGRGRSLLELQQLDKAIASIERAVLINPRLNGYYRLGLAYQAKGDKPKAIAALQQALSLNLNGKAAEDARKRLAELGV